MDTLLLEDYPKTDDLLKRVYEGDLPVALSDGASECLIVMTPEAFERILFDTTLLNLDDRRPLKL